MGKRSSRDDRGRVRDYDYRREQREAADREYRKARDERSRRRDEPRREREGILSRIFGRRGDGHQ